MANGKGMNIMGAALLGMVAGAIAGVLLAPKSGKETREDLARKAAQMRGDITERMRRLGKVTRVAYDEVVDTVVNQYRDAKEITSQQAEKLKGELREGFDRVKQVAEETTRESEPMGGRRGRTPAA